MVKVLCTILGGPVENNLYPLFVFDSIFLKTLRTQRFSTHNIDQNAEFKGNIVKHLTPKFTQEDHIC